MSRFLNSLIAPPVSALPTTGVVVGQMCYLTTNNQVYYYDGTWTSLSSSGTSIINFGSGATDANVFVSDSTIISTSVPAAGVALIATADHSADEHFAEDITVFVGAPIAGSGFYIYARTGGPYLLYGRFTVAWSWN